MRGETEKDRKYELGESGVIKFKFFISLVFYFIFRYDWRKWIQYAFAQQRTIYSMDASKRIYACYAI